MPVNITCFCAVVRYGSCVPFSPYLLGTGGIPCDEVYETGTDYVYIKNGNESLQPLSLLGGIENQLHDLFSTDDCTLSTIRMMCHYYLPPCGNSTHFEPPTSVCSDACVLLSQMCPFHWTYIVESELGLIDSYPLNCSYMDYSVLNPLPHSCSNLGIYTSGCISKYLHIGFLNFTVSQLFVSHFYAIVNR